MKTSISDYDNYKNFCLEASLNENIFNNFKKNPIYCEILEHASYNDGLNFIKTINEIKSINLDVELLNKFKENDKHGNADVIDYGGTFGKISPSTLRYIKVLFELNELFGDLSDKKICEIGVGYGGQAKIISDFYKNIDYTFVDLPEVNKLTEKYLSKFEDRFSSKTFYDVSNLPDNLDFDLIISNYAFTECEINIQKLYYDRIIKKSKSGFMICNIISDKFGVNSMTKDDLISMKDNISVMEERPNTFNKNFVIYWR